MSSKLSLLLICLLLLFVGCTPIGEAEPPATVMLTESTTAATTAPPVTTTVATTTTVPPLNKRLEFLAVGDNLIHTYIFYDAGERAEAMGNSGAYDFSGMYDGIRPLVKAADIAYINQETPLAGEEYGYSGYPQFNTPREMGTNLVEMGFDIINIANNHMLDMRDSGLVATIDYWDTQDVLQIGGYRDQQDYDTIRYYEYDGVTIAFLSYTYGTNGIPLQGKYDLVIPLPDDETIKRHLTEARENADFVFVSFHWGWEDTFDPNDDQKHYAALCNEYGADVIIGTHPHVLQPIEVLTNEGGHETLVIYSLGNLLSTQNYYRNMVGGLVTFDIVMTDDLKAIENVKLTPTMTYYNSRHRELSLYLLEDFPRDMVSTHGAQVNKYFTYETLADMVIDVIPEEYLNFSPAE
ncbi:MAG: CapA family protein [Ruminococcus sp.]|jgi:poly-gamma-glutamate synthesis protein (capsule biosynthesis protein)|nr:CapA family protein [Ruminococcus sp.]